MAEIGAGTVYDFNKIAMEKQPKLNKPILNKKKNLLSDYFSEKDNEFFMLLCNELKDYTVLKFKNKDMDEGANAIIDCLQNRGSIMAIDRTKDGVAVELWIRYNKDKELHCYYLFPYDNAIVEV